MFGYQRNMLFDIIEFSNGSNTIGTQKAGLVLRCPTGIAMEPLMICNMFGIRNKICSIQNNFVEQQESLKSAAHNCQLKLEAYPLDTEAKMYMRSDEFEELVAPKTVPHTQRNSSMDKYKLQQAREQHEKYYAQMEEDLDLAETMTRLGFYEDALNLYDFFLERYGRDERLLWNLSECLKLYHNNLIENENTKRAIELEEKYAPVLSEINVSPL